MTDIQTIYSLLRQGGMTETGALAMMGNWMKESLLDPFRKQGDLTDAALPSHRYVADVTGGKIHKIQFASDGIGFGLAQWTYWDKNRSVGRKLDLYQFWKSSGLPLDSAIMQTRFALWELKNCREYSGLWSFLCTVELGGLKNAVDRVCREFERPAFNNITERYDAAQMLAARLDLNDTTVPASGKPQNVSESNTGSQTKPDTPSTPFWPPRGAIGGREDPGLCVGMVGMDVMLLQTTLTCRGFGCKADGIFTTETEEMVRAFQRSCGLEADGIAGKNTWRALLSYL